MVFPSSALTGRKRSSRGDALGRKLLAALLLCALLPRPCLSASCLTAEPLFEITSAGGVTLRQPSDLSTHEDALFVLDDINGRVIRFSLDGDYLSSFPIPGGSRAAYLGIDVGGDDNVYLAASKAGKIRVVSQAGELLREFGTVGTDSGSEPVSVVFSRGNIFVVDKKSHKVKAFDLEGALIEQWGGLGEGGSSFRYPFRILQDPIGRIIVSDSLNSRIKVFTPKGEPLAVFGEFGVVEGKLFRPAGIASWDEDTLFVADNYHGAIQLFDMRGSYIGVVCGQDDIPLLFENPVSLASGASTLFVLEMGAGRVRALGLQRR